METKYKYKNTPLTITRYPKTEDRTLKAWSNAEVYALEQLGEASGQHIVMYNDRFGFWNTCLNNEKLTTVWHYESQRKAIKQNLEQNGFSFNEDTLFKSTDKLNKPIDIALVKVPKSVELFHHILEHIHANSHKDTKVICCFMTKYFNKQIIEKSNLYFEEVEQSLAWKKSRLVHLKSPKQEVASMKLRNIKHNGEDYKQYPGVFSASHIDYASQFLMDNVEIKPEEVDVMDLASGNGVIARFIQDKNPSSKLTLVDDYNLAIESSKLNVENTNTTFLCADSLDDIESDTFDLIISNPPFHFEHEINIDITLRLMEQVQQCLKPEGRFVFVANEHLNYKTHLIQWFTDVKIIAKNDKFVVCECLV